MNIKTKRWQLGLGLMCACGTTLAAGLESALYAALSQHPAVTAKRAEVVAKGHLGDSARAQRLPTLSAQYAAQDNHTNPGNLRARQPLWAFGRIDSNIAYADADVTAEEADLLRVRRQIMDQTGAAYVRVLGARQRLDIASENLAALDLLHQKIQRREQGQLASVADVRLALARLTQARGQQERLAGELEVARTDLWALTQVQVAADRAVPDTVTRLPAGATLETLAEAQSADLRLKAQRVALARAEVERENAAPMPTVYLQADKAMNQPVYGNDVRVGVVLEASLDGMGFAAGGRSRAALARQQAADDDLRAMRLELGRLVKSLSANRQLQQTLIRTQGQSVAELREIFASYQRQYEAGQKAWLDVLNMRRELVEQQLQQVQAENDWLTYSLKLAALTGGLDALAETAASAAAVGPDSVQSAMLPRRFAAAVLTATPLERVTPPPVDSSAAAAPVAAAAQSPAGDWVVQLGAHRNHTRAVTLAQRLRVLGLPAFTEERSTERVARTRVRVGPFASREEADQARERLASFSLVGYVKPN